MIVIGQCNAHTLDERDCSFCRGLFLADCLARLPKAPWLPACAKNEPQQACRQQWYVFHHDFMDWIAFCQLNVLLTQCFALALLGTIRHRSFDPALCSVVFLQSTLVFSLFVGCRVLPEQAGGHVPVPGGPVAQGQRRERHLLQKASHSIRTAATPNRPQEGSPAVLLILYSYQHMPMGLSDQSNLCLGSNDGTPAGACTEPRIHP